MYIFNEKMCEWKQSIDWIGTGFRNLKRLQKSRDCVWKITLIGGETLKITVTIFW